MRTRLRRLIHGAQSGQRLDVVLGGWLPDALGRQLSRSSLRRLIMAGAVRVDGRSVRRPGLLLTERQEIRADLDLARLTGAEGGTGTPVALTRGAILWQDEWLIAVAKPAGLAFHPTADGARASLVAAVKQLLGARAGGAGEPYLGVHQRLDVGTSGVALFVLRPEANAGLARALSEGQVDKIYHALTARISAEPRKAWTIDRPLAPSGSGRRARMTPSADGQAARTLVHVLRQLPAALLVEARPATGRKHQIRAHLAAEGLPLLGDARYGGPDRIGPLRFPRPMLHALRVALPHPRTGDRLLIECPYPDDFRLALAGLAAGQSR